MMWRNVSPSAGSFASIGSQLSHHVRTAIPARIVTNLSAASRPSATVTPFQTLVRSLHRGRSPTSLLNRHTSSWVVPIPRQQYHLVTRPFICGYLIWHRPSIYKAVANYNHVFRRDKNTAAENTVQSERKVAQAKTTGLGTPDPAKDSAAASPFLDRISNLHAPTKEELLAAANGFWSRLGVRFKWFSIRSGRKFTADEIFGFISWIFLGHLVFFLVATTTFLSLFILAVNTVFAQEAIGQWVGGYLTKSSGMRVVFESAIVPKWNEGVISFGKVFVSRRPGQGKAKVEKGSQAAAAAAASSEDRSEVVTDLDDGNYSQFDITIETVNVTLSFAKWFNGKGLLQNVELKGVRGVLDRTHVRPLDHYVDPKSWKHEHNTGDFELDSFKMEDLLITVYQPSQFRPFQISIFACDLPQLRQQWLFYDFMSANNISGSVDGSLFTLHPRQTNNYTESRLGGTSESPITWKKQSRLRIDGLNIDHLNRGVEGPFSWIRDGNVDIVADIMFPADDDASVAKVMSDVFDRLEATVITNSIPPTKKSDVISMQDLQAVHDGGQPSPVLQPVITEDERYWIMDVKIHLNDVRAAVPFLTKDISYVNNALIRPIVAYINTKRTFIPINCRVVKRRDDFDGSWTMFDSELLDDLNREVYDAFVKDVLNDAHARRRRIKKVGIWTLQLAAQALFVGMAGNFA